MNWKASPPAIEIAAVAVSVACLGSAVCFAVARAAPLGAGWVEAGISGACAAIGGGWLIARVDRRPHARKLAPLVESPGDEALADEVALPEDVDAEILLLDDPLPEAEPPRVVRLFAAAPANEEIAPPLVGPGEMIARIENFLGHSRDGATVETPAIDERAHHHDANAALHAALADIRRSLRQG